MDEMPETLYAVIEPADDDCFIIASDDPKTLLESDEDEVRVGVYTRTGYATIKQTITVEPHQ